MTLDKIIQRKLFNSETCFQNPPGKLQRHAAQTLLHLFPSTLPPIEQEKNLWDVCESLSSFIRPGLQESASFHSILEKEKDVVQQLLQGWQPPLHHQHHDEDRPFRIVDFGGGNGWFGALVALQCYRQSPEQKQAVEVWVIEPERRNQTAEFAESSDTHARNQVRHWLSREWPDFERVLHMRYLSWNGLCIVEMNNHSIDLFLFRVSLHHMEPSAVREHAISECIRGLKADGQVWMKEHDGSRHDQRMNADLSHLLFQVPRWAGFARQGNKQRMMAEIAHYLDHEKHLCYYGKSDWEQLFSVLSDGKLHKCLDANRHGVVEKGKKGSSDPMNYSYLFWHVYQFASSSTEKKDPLCRVQEIQRKYARSK